MIYYGRQSVNEQDIHAVEKVLRSDFLTQGPSIERFEQRVAEYCGAKHRLLSSRRRIADVIAGQPLTSWILTT